MERVPPSSKQSPAGSASGSPTRERDLLLTLSAAAQKYAIYPRGHPMLEGEASRVRRHVQTMVETDGLVAMGVGRDRVLMGEVAVAADVPLLRDLSRRVLEHHVGAITFHEGVTVAEVDRLLAGLASEPTQEALTLPGVVAIRLRSLDYDRIGLGAEERLAPDPTESPGALWDALARTALTDPPADGDEARAIATAVAAHPENTAFMTVVAAHLVRVVSALRRTDAGEEATRTRMRVTELIRHLDPATLRALVRFDEEGRRRAELLRAAATALSPDALVRLLGAAAEASATSVSQGLLRVLAKLAAVTATGPAEARAGAAAELRRTMDRLLSDWTLEDPNPEQYGRVLDTVSFGRMAATDTTKQRRYAVGVQRVLEVSREVGAWGPAAERVAQTLLDQGDVKGLLEMVRSEDGDDEVRRELAAVVLTPRLIYLMTATDEVDRDALLEVSSSMGVPAIDPLLDALADSPSRNVRRCAFDCLSQMGAPAAARALNRASDERWFVKRNMLALVATVPVPEDVDVMRWFDDEDPRVRVQAVAVARRAPNPDPVLSKALQDADPRVVTAALRGIDAASPALVPLLGGVARDDADEENRVLAVRALGTCRDPVARDALVSLTGVSKNWFGRMKFRRRTPEALESVRALARGWSEDASVRPVLEAARGSGVAAIRRATEQP